MSEDHDVIGALVGQPPHRAGPLTEGDADQLAAYLAGALEGEAHVAFEARLADDDDLRAAWRAIHTEPRAGMTQRRGHPLLIWFASAAALIALVLGAWVLSRPNVRPTLDRLSDRLSALQASTPDLFRGMRVLAPGELAVGPRVVERSGLELRAPRGRVLSTAPVLTWVLPLGASSASVRIEDEETGEVVFEAEAERDHLALPAQPPVLAAGRRYVWSVTARGTLGELRGSSLVEVASAVRAKRFRAQLEALGLPANTASQPDPIAALLGVHVAIREDLWLEAQRLLGTLGSMDAPEQAHANQVRRLIQARLAGAR